MGVYCTRADVDLVYGSLSVEKWADLNNNDVLAEIDARATWAMELSFEQLNAMLDGGPYVVPFAVSPSSPAIIKDLAARWSGWLLYQSRGLVDAEDATENQLIVHRDYVTETVKSIHASNTTLIGLTRTRTIPQVG